MTTAELHDLVETTMDGWNYGSVVGPGNPMPDQPDVSIDATDPASWVSWSLDDEFGERLTVGTDLYEGAVILIVATQMGDGDDNTHAVRAEIGSRFRAATSGDITFDPVELGEDLAIEGAEEAVAIRELRVPYRRQEHH